MIVLKPRSNLSPKTLTSGPALETYVTDSHGPTNHYTLEVLDMFAIDRVNHGSKLDPKNYFASVSNHQLLFHGSRMSNTVGIFSEGLRIPKLIRLSMVLLWDRDLSG